MDEARAANRERLATYRARGGRGVKDGDEAEHEVQMKKKTERNQLSNRRQKDRAVKAGLRAPKGRLPSGQSRGEEHAALPYLKGLGSCTYATSVNARDHTRIRIRVKKKSGNSGSFRKELIDLPNDIADSPDETTKWWNSVEDATAAFNAYFEL